MADPEGPTKGVLLDVLATVTAAVAQDHDTLEAVATEAIDRHGLADFLEGVYWTMGAFMADTCNRTGDEPHAILQRIALQVALHART
jgi:hypothetical protein